MKENIHPPYKKFKIIVGQDEFWTYSSSNASEMLMDVDYRKHPAWTKETGNFINESNESITKFSGKYAGLTFGTKK